MLVLHPRAADLRRAISRRDWLRAGLGGSLAFWGAVAGAPRWAAAENDGSAAASRCASFGRARSCILVYLFGGPAHQDVWDLKPEAPAEIRGEFRPISTAVPGIQITEHLPLLAARAERFSIIRSLTHGDNAHGSASHQMLTGRRPRNLGEVPPEPDDHPCYGSALAQLLARAQGRAGTGETPVSLSDLPTFISLPQRITTSTNIVPGQDGGFLGASMAPFRVEIDRETLRFDASGLSLRPEVSPEHLLRRRTLLESLDRRGVLGADRNAEQMRRIYDRAYNLLTSTAASGAFNLDREPPELRERYGMNAFGQCMLLARRLVEAGVPWITVFWPDRTEPEAFLNNGVLDSAAVPPWDTHGSHVGSSANFPMLRDRLLPPLDQASSALLDDLAERGLLGETLVAWTGEFGRTPRINEHAGRDHYGNVFSAMLAGGGIAGGRVHGSSDADAAFPASDPVSPGDFAATLYHCLGYAPETEVYDRLDRPVRLAEGTPIASLLL